MIWIYGLVFVLLFISSIEPAKAVMPPDFVFNIGMQIVQVFSVISIFFLAALSVSYQFIKTRLAVVKSKWFWFISIAIILVISLGIAYFYGYYKQGVEYKNWLNLSKKNTQKTVVQDDLDKLQLGKQGKKVPMGDKKFVSNIDNDLNDPVTKFIMQYYQNIAEGKLDAAYEMSKKSADLETFKSWYQNTTGLSLDKLVRIDNEKSSLELTLYEGSNYTIYGVLMTLVLDNGQPVAVEKSEVRVLGIGNSADTGGSSNDDNSFFVQNKDKNVAIGNDDFKKAVASQNNYVILDAREDIEYENGNYPGSTHIRFADIKAGRWIELPKDKYIYVFCWSGIRGKEVADFLRKKEIVAMYLENGASGWYESGGKWDGNIKFVKKYSEERFQLVFNTDEVKQKVSEGVVLVDTREPAVFRSGHIDGAVNIPIMYTPTLKLDETFNQVPANSKVITVCDGYVNCFDAKITGVELEKRGHQFLGRYNKPWEY